MTLVEAPTKIALVAGMILLVVVSVAAYSKYTQTKAWIFGDGPYGPAIVMSPTFEISVTKEEVARYPTLKEYIDYIDSTAIMPHGSVSIDLGEARSLVSFLSQKASFVVQPQPGGMAGEWYSFKIDVNDVGYGINIVFSNERPILD